MSHRVTTQTEITDRALAIQSLTAAQMSFREEGSILKITGGKLRGARIDLGSGIVSGDSDYHTSEDLGALRIYYGEAKYRKECLLQGITIKHREVLANGDVKLHCMQ